MSIKLDQVQEELGTYIQENPNLLSSMVYEAEITVNKYAQTLTKINGEYPMVHSLMSHVVQGFKSEWQELGEANFRAKLLKSFKQKVNFSFKPSDMLGTWLAKLYTEGKDAKDHQISEHITDDLKKQVIIDLEILSMEGERDDANADGEFGKSLNGLLTLLKKGLLSATDPMFSIPLEVAVLANILDVVEEFETGIPLRYAKGPVFMSRPMALLYKKAWRDTYGDNTDFSANSAGRTPLLDLEIIVLPIPGNVIFTTVDGNLKRLIDIIDKPEITDIQKQDYVLKLFMEFTLNYDFAINQLVFVGNFDGDAVRGLGNNELNKIYFPQEVFEPVTP
ncbi:hypothetical protein [Paenimyroides baculatum]|uniref:Uncharacterized protein n=1 Tax=Paenimyroides baculatum TaxID=2608000 RepID=A0A5M6CCD7_9FLAO|nr:hypothetical protein [Paenimyroides baculatum]KAA5532796.1 hypothetical protein F0460_13200 [Paenimyroides baculatum]